MVNTRNTREGTLAVPSCPDEHTSGGPNCLFGFP
jgi:hypothetical protein